jgi:lipopolysaccharide transport system ATP-binding protein
MQTVLTIENLWKEYRLGVIGHGTLRQDIQAWWSKIRGLEDPNRPIARDHEKAKQIEGDHFWALRGISLKISQGEIFGIIGKNGAGKSTLLKILSRVTTPTKGLVKVKGRMASLLEVGTGFHPELTGRENIFMNGAILGMSKFEIVNKLDEIVDFSGIESFIETPVKRYSSGMRVRLAFAVAAHLEPEIMIIDEVLSVGDAEFQKKCLGKMNSIVKQGRTILFVSHNMAAIKNLTSRCMLMEGGTISNIGNPIEIIEEYLQRNSDQCRYNFEDYERKKVDWGKIIRIIEIIPCPDNNGQAKYKQDIDLLVRLNSKIEMANLRFGITIQNMLEVPILASFSNNDIRVVPHRENELSIKLFDHRLVPGKYNMSISIGYLSDDGKNITYDGIIEGPNFEVTPVADDNESVLHWNDSWGSLFHEGIKVTSTS